MCGPLSFPRAGGGGGPALWTDPGCSGHSTYSALRCPPAALHPLPTSVLTQPEPPLSSPRPPLFPLPSPHFSSLTGATEMARRPNRVSKSSRCPAQDGAKSQLTMLWEELASRAHAKARTAARPGLRPVCPVHVSSANDSPWGLSFPSWQVGR